MDIKIRSAIIDDAQQVCNVLRRSITELCYLDHGGDEKHLRKWLSNKTVENVSQWILQNHFFVAEDRERIVGAALMLGTGKITLNYIDPDFRFCGVSKKLVLSMEERAKSLGLAECYLESSKTALRFYQDMGYIKSEKIYIPPAGESPALLISKSL